MKKGITLLRRNTMAGVAAELLVSDDFSEADTTNLHGKSTDTAQTWVVNGAGSWTISGAKLTTSASGGNFTAYVETGVSDVDMSVLVTKRAANSDGGIMFRFVDTANYIVATLIHGGSMYLSKFVSSSGINLAVVNGLFTGAGDHPLRVIANGASIIVYVDGVEVANVSDSAHLTATKHGFVASYVAVNSNGTDFDNYTIHSI